MVLGGFSDPRIIDRRIHQQTPSRPQSHYAAVSHGRNLRRHQTVQTIKSYRERTEGETQRRTGRREKVKKRRRVTTVKLKAGDTSWHDFKQRLPEFDNSTGGKATHLWTLWKKKKHRNFELHLFRCLHNVTTASIMKNDNYLSEQIKWCV